MKERIAHRRDFVNVLVPSLLVSSRNFESPRYFLQQLVNGFKRLRAWFAIPFEFDVQVEGWSGVGICTGFFDRRK